MSLRTIASLLGASGIGLGAFGAHGLKNRLSSPGKMDNWKTAVMYQLFHSVAILSISNLSDKFLLYPSVSYKLAGQLMAIGTVMFSGSIYLLCLDVGNKKILGPTTPIGGLLMMVGWFMLSF